MSASERRILFTHWLAEAWEDYTTNCQEEITNAFKRYDMDGKENDLAKMQGVPEYKAPAKGDPKMEDPLKGLKRKRKDSQKQSEKKQKS